MKSNPMWTAWDDHPPTGDWPGGTRYGFKRELAWKVRVWSKEDRLLANAWGVNLPHGELQPMVHESWYDRQRLHDVVVEWVEEEVVDWRSECPVQTKMCTVQKIVTARLYANDFWVGDPLANVRHL